MPNATVLAVASIILMVQPPNGRVPVLVAGLAVMLAVNLVLMRRAFAPLGRLTGLMRRIDPLQPGERLPEFGGSEEVVLLAEAFNEMLDRLESERRESGLRALAEREDERRTLAAELHDDIGQNLTAIALQLDRLADRVSDDHREEIAAVREAVSGTIEQTRGLARALRPEALDALGLVPALANLAQRLSHQTGVRIERDMRRDLPPLSPEAELVLYRIAQESLTNALRHAAAARVTLTLRSDGQRVDLRVADDGAGVETVNGSGGSGIRTMRERALSVGGRLIIGPAGPAGGTEVHFSMEADGA